MIEPRWRLAVSCCALLLSRVALGDAAASPDAGLPCDSSQSVDEYQLLRRLSLDLRGQPPTLAEYSEIDSGKTASDLAAQWTTAWDPHQPAPDSSHEGFRQRMRHYHSILLWPNVTLVQLAQVTWTLRTDSATGVYFLNSAGRQRQYYASNPDWNPPMDVSVITSALCDSNREQPPNGYYPELDPAHPIYRPIPQTESLPDGGTHQWVGTRTVTPYFPVLVDGGLQATIRVCAYDAQETLEVYSQRLPDAGSYQFVDPSQSLPVGGGVGAVAAVSCDSSNLTNGAGNTWCGCGPNLRYCMTGQVQADIQADLAEQVLRSIDQVTVGGKPYTDVLLGTQALVSGRLAAWQAYLSGTNLNSEYSAPDPDDHFVPPAQLDSARPGELPLADYQDQTWYAVTRPQGHAGVLTLPGYLLRFQTNRSRANRFRNAFLCQYFIPPNQLTDAPPQCDPATSDLMRKCNCRLCHATLEPLAAHWGRFAESGTSQLGADAGFPSVDPTCAPNPKTGAINRSQRCARFYVTDTSFDELAGAGSSDGTNHFYEGVLRPYLYSDLHVQSDPAHPGQTSQVIQAHIEGGPQLLRGEYVDDPGHDFAHCTVQKVFAYLVQRDLRVNGSENDEAPLLEQLVGDFIGDSADPYDFAKLVREITSLPQYRRIR